MSIPHVATLLSQEYNRYVNEEQQVSPEETMKCLHKGIALAILGIVTWKAISKIVTEDDSPSSGETLLP